MRVYLKNVAPLLAPLALGVTHVHQDVVFVEHNLFLFLLPKRDDGPVGLVFNRECPPDLAAKAAVTIFEAARQTNLDVALRGSYALEEMEDEQLRLVFLPETPWPGGAEGAPEQ